MKLRNEWTNEKPVKSEFTISDEFKISNDELWGQLNNEIFTGSPKEPPLFETQIENCLNLLDFDRIHTVMHYLDWKWVTVDLGPQCPSFVELRAEVKRLLQCCVTDWQKEHRKWHVATGGFSADITQDGFLSIQFILSDADTYWMT